MKQFDLEAAKNGAPVCTRDGRKARIICFDRKTEFDTIVALVEDKGIEWTTTCDKNGRFIQTKEHPNDLMMYEKPEPQLKPFDKVLVRIGEKEKWDIDIFSHKCEGDGLTYVCLCYRWAYCIPYEGNEHLLGTTDSPKEDEA